MITKVWPQPLIVVRDVPASSRFYAQILEAESAHGGDEYEQLVSGGELILQLHQIDVEDHHGPLASPMFPSATAVCSGSRCLTSMRLCDG